MGDADFGAELRRLRTAAGWSLTDLAKRIHYTKGYLSKVENGVVPPNEALAMLCDTELDTGGVLIAVVPRRRHRTRQRTFTVRPSGLPPATPLFTGRDAELAAVCGTLRGGPTGVCVIDGMAGSGKTALAVCAAHHVQDEFPDGTLFLDLLAHTGGELDSAAALDALLRQLGVPGDEIPTSEQERAVLYRGCLRGRTVLVVIDNAGSSGQVLPLLPGEPACRALVTSRNRLIALDDARHVSLGPMSEAAAGTLFGSVAGHPDTAADRQALARIVDRCGRLPLAIRIAAARYAGNPAMTLADLDERLAAQRFDELDDGERSVRGAFQLSYDGLPAEQRLLLALLPLYPGAEVDEHTAAALTGEPVPGARRSLDRLQAAHLLVPQPGGRYRCHDLVRAFAAETARREIPADRRRQAVLRMVDGALYAAEQADIAITPGRYRPVTTYDHLPPDPVTFDPVSAPAWLDREWSALAALVEVAAKHGLHDRAWRLAFLLRGYFFQAKLWQPWITTHTVALASARAAHDRWAEGVTLDNLGIAHVDRGELDAAAACYRDALTLFTDIADERGATDARANLGWVHHYRGEHETARTELSAALEYYRRHGADRNAAITLRGIALAETELGRYDDSIAHATEALAVCERLGLELDAGMALNCLGWTYFRAGRHTESGAAYRKAVVVGERAGSRYEVARAMTGLGNIAAAADDPTTAQRLWDEAAEHHPDLNTTVIGETRVRTVR